MKKDLKELKENYRKEIFDAIEWRGGGHTI